MIHADQNEFDPEGSKSKWPLYFWINQQLSHRLRTKYDNKNINIEIPMLKITALRKHDFRGKCNWIAWNLLFLDQILSRIDRMNSKCRNRPCEYRCASRNWLAWSGRLFIQNRMRQIKRANYKSQAISLTALTLVLCLRRSFIKRLIVNSSEFGDETHVSFMPSPS